MAPVLERARSKAAEAAWKARSPAAEERAGAEEEVGAT
jgi:hypothetical protein